MSVVSCRENHVANLRKTSKEASCVEIVMLEKLDCILSKRATRPYIYESTSVNACVRSYV
jgi:hypothetical protein